MASLVFFTWVSLHGPCEGVTTSKMEFSRDLQ